MVLYILSYTTLISYRPQIIFQTFTVRRYLLNCFCFLPVVETIHTIEVFTLGGVPLQGVSGEIEAGVRANIQCKVKETGACRCSEKQEAWLTYRSAAVGATAHSFCAIFVSNCTPRIHNSVLNTDTIHIISDSA